MYGTCLLMMLMLSNTCDHRIVVADRDCGEFCLVISEAHDRRAKPL